VKYLKTISTNNYDMSFTTVDAIGFKNVTNTNDNLSLYRNTNVTDPNVNFDIAEWTAYPMNYSTDLGTFLTTETPELSNFEFSIYPNPVANVLHVKGENISKITKAQIYDITGKLILEFEKPFVFKNNIDVSELSSGLYFIKIGDFSEKFIKK
jgi:hypothetical protein